MLKNNYGKPSTEHKLQKDLFSAKLSRPDFGHTNNKQQNIPNHKPQQTYSLSALVKGLDKLPALNIQKETI